jgi:hypothetical protein
VCSSDLLVADLGAGFAQSGDLRHLPPALAELFGVAPAPEDQKGSWPPPFGELRAGSGGGPNPAALATTLLPHARFPSLHQSMLHPGGVRLGSFDAPIYLVTLWGGAAPVLLQANQGSTFSGVMARQLAAGWAVYATTRLWQNWPPGEATFDAFHRDLLGFDSPIALKRPARLFAPGDDVAAFQDGSIMLLKARPPAAGKAEPTELLLRNPTGRVYQVVGGMQEIRSADVSANSLLTFGRPGLQVAEPLPIEVSVVGAHGRAPVQVQVVSYGPEGISFALYGPATKLLTSAEGVSAVTAGGEATAHVRISPAFGGQAGAGAPAAGQYRVRRGSRHEIAIRRLRDERSALRTITVGEEGVLAFDAPANTVVTIKPLL